MNADATQSRTRVRCACGQVELEATGAPITVLVCYCDDCQAGARRIESLPGAGAVIAPDGGTTLALWRKDRVRCLRGESLLQGVRIRDRTKTERLVATCCNSAMLVRFDDTRPWVSVFRNRVQGEKPSPEMRIMTKFRPKGTDLPDDLPSYSTYPLRLPAKLVGALLARLLGR
jgi:hypothetical protein